MTTATKNNGGRFFDWITEDPRVAEAAPRPDFKVYVTTPQGNALMVVEDMHAAVSSGGSVGSFSKAIPIVLRDEVEQAMWNEFAAWDQASDEDLLDFERGVE